MERTYVRVLKVTIHCLLVVIMMCLIQQPAFAGSAAASYGLQAGAQSFGYAMFLMTDEALKGFPCTSKSS